MKTLAMLTTLAILSPFATAVEKLPTHTQSYYHEGQFNEHFMGKLAAVEAVITKIEKGPEDRPIFQVTLAEGVDKNLWVASLATIKEDMIDVGAKVRILGYFDKTAEETEYMSKLSQDKEYLLGFCFYDLATERTMYRPRWMDMCIDWEVGNPIEQLTGALLNNK